jgi:hypothetical protein
MNITRQRWERGMCPCCGVPAIFGWTDGNGREYEPMPIAEGVMICGMCVCNECCSTDTEDGKISRGAILNAIVNG